VSIAVERAGELHVEGVALADIAERFHTPCYVYSKAALLDALEQYRCAFGQRSHLILYAVKANSNLAILRLFAERGCGFDIVSGGELARVLAAGADPAKVVFSGVGKSKTEILQALSAGIACFNVESEAEMERISELASARGTIARVSLRVNPDVDAHTHPYIATGLKEDKFGIAHQDALRVYRKARTLPGLEIAGIDCHIGSQLTSISPFSDAIARLLELYRALQAEGLVLEHIDLGGGLGIRYQTEEHPPTIGQYVAALLAALGDTAARVLIEPGRSLVGDAGLLLTRTEYVKSSGERCFVIVDAAMNDLLRPALYDAWHEIRPVRTRAGGGARVCQVVGPVCESGDFLGKDRLLNVEQGDLLAVLSAGAYGMSMSSNYNTRARAAEVMIDADRAHLIRSRESVAELYAREHFLPRHDDR
jgi:diaminopimelate decarboxylase